MAETIQTLEKFVGEIAKDASYSPEQKKKANEIFTIIATRKGISTLEVNATSKEEIKFLLQDLTIDADLSVNMISDKLSAVKIPETQITTTSPNQAVTETPKPEDTEKELRAQGWTDLYIFSKMISLGFVPKLHDMKHKGSTEWLGLKWIFKNALYMSVGGPLTNGTLNNKNNSYELGKNLSEWIAGLVTSEKGEIRLLLKELDKNPVDGNRGFIKDRLKSLDDLEKAIRTGNHTIIQEASINYNKQAETSGTIKDLYKKYKISAKNIRKETIGESDIDKVSNEIKTNRETNAGIGTPTGKYEKYANEYEKLIKDLDSKGISLGSPEREQAIIDLDKKIAKREIQLNKINNEKKKAILQEHSEITSEIKKTDAEIIKLKIETEKRLQELDKLAGDDKIKLNEARNRAEGLISSHNKKIAILESQGISELKKLNSNEIKVLSGNSKWVQEMVKINGGIDKFTGGKRGKVVGVGAMILIAKGGYDALKADGISKETGLNLLDIGAGIVPIAGGIWDLYRAYQGTDLNGKKLSDNERWTRAGFGVIGLVPGVGTAVKWAANSGKIVKTAEGATKVARTGEAIYEGGKLVGKTTSLGYLGYTAGTTTYELLPSMKK